MLWLMQLQYILLGWPTTLSHQRGISDPDAIRIMDIRRVTRPSINIYSLIQLLQFISLKVGQRKAEKSSPG